MDRPPGRKKVAVVGGPTVFRNQKHSGVGV